MNINPLSDTLNAGANLTGAIMGGLDSLFTSDDERLKAKAIIDAQIQQFEAAIQKEVTSRHAADMQSDNFLSKNIRPASLIILTIAFFVFVIADVREAHIEAITTLLQTAFGFYFGFRGVEKSVKIFSGGRK